MNGQLMRFLRYRRADLIVVILLLGLAAAGFALVLTDPPPKGAVDERMRYAH